MPKYLSKRPSPAIVICVSVGAICIGLPVVSSTALPLLSANVPSGSRPKRPSLVSRGPALVLTVKYPSPASARDR